jgi:hypothetical protein
MTQKYPSASKEKQHEYRKRFLAKKLAEGGKFNE